VYEALVEDEAYDVIRLSASSRFALRISLGSLGGIFLAVRHPIDTDDPLGKVSSA
jgi:hypothetical protein